MEKNKIIVVLIATFFFSYVALNLYNSSQEREKYKLVTVCYVNNGNIGRSSRHINGYFFYRGKKYDTYEIVHDNPNKYIGKYYKIIISSKDPENNEIFYNEEVTDINEIKKAAF